MKRPTSFRFSEATLADLRRVADFLGMTQSAVLAMLVRDEARAVSDLKRSLRKAKV